MDRSKWEYKKLGEVATFLNGYAFKPENWSKHGLKIIRIQNLTDETSPYNCYDGEIDSKYIVRNGDLLISWSATLGAFLWNNDDALLNQHIFKAIFDKSDIDKYYLKYCVISKLEEMAKKTHGVTMRHITKKDFDNTIIPYPSLSDQQRIVAELDCLNEMIAVKKEQLKEFDKLAQSIFYDMFGDPVVNEKGWDINSMSEVCNGIGDGLHGTPQYDADGEIAFINGNNLIEGKIVITERTQFVNENEAKKIYVELDSNTILLSINGTLGKTAIYNNERVVLGKSACYLRFGNLLNVRFVMALMNTDEFLHFLENNSSQSTIKNVGLKAIRNYKIIIPPLSLQQQFAEKISAIEAQKELVKQSIAETQHLLDYTMDKYFG